MSQKPLEELGSRIRELFAATPANDLERNLRMLLSGFFSRLDLVNREEFDVQAKVLARAQEKLATLEARVRDLEKQQTS